MHCHLCQIEGSSDHESTTEHQAARQLAATAVDRLSNFLVASEDSEDATSVAGTDKTEAVGYCIACNIVVPINEQSAHFRKKDHAIALLNEQIFEELVHAYVFEAEKSEPADSSDDGVFVDENEALNTYTCHLCDIQVPRVFKLEHERGTRHRSCRKLTLAAARRARDFISARSVRKDVDKVGGPRRMMKKLLKAYCGREDKSEGIGEEIEPRQQDPKRLTAKEYFTDILPLLSYVTSFYTLIVDDTEFVTIQISNETLKIHVNNFNGLLNFDGNDVYYMNCRLCDGFSNVCYSSLGQQDKMHVMSLGHIKNVLSPIENLHLIRKIEETHSICALCNVHIASHLVDNHILKDTRHSMALTEAIERGKEYKANKEDLIFRIFMPPAPKQNVFMKPNQFNNNQNRWTFGFPQQPRSLLGSVFGSAQNTGFANAQNTGFGSTQSNTFGNSQNTGFGSTQGTTFGNSQNTGFGNTQGTTFGIAQNTGFGNTQGTTFGNAQNTGFGSTQGTTFGNSQNTGFGNTQGTTFGNAQNTGFGSTKNANFGNAQNTGFGFGSAQNNGTAQTGFGTAQNSIGGTKTSLFGVALTEGQSNAFHSNKTQQNTTAIGTALGGFGSTRNNGSTPPTIGSAQTSFGSAQNSIGGKKGSIFGVSQTGDQSSLFNSNKTQQNITAFGTAQSTNLSAQIQGQASANSDTNQSTPALWNNPVSFGKSPPITTDLGAQKKTIVANAQLISVKLCAAQNKAQPDTVNTAESQGTEFGASQNTGNAQIGDTSGVKTAVNATQPMNKSTTDPNIPTPARRESNSGESQPNSKDGTEQEENKFGDAQTQSKNMPNAQINKSKKKKRPPMKQNTFSDRKLTSSSDSN